MKLLGPHVPYSPEPWLPSPDYGAIVTCQPHPGARRLCPEYGGFLVAEGFSQEDRRRAMACVNVCRGLPTELLESLYGSENCWTLERFGQSILDEAQKLREIFESKESEIPF